MLPVGIHAHQRMQTALKKLTRRQAQAWLFPMRQCFRQILNTGETDAIRGYAVTKLYGSDDYARIDYCCAGFRGLMERICPHVGIDPLRRIEQLLAAGAVLTEQILIEMDEIRVAA